MVHEQQWLPLLDYAVLYKLSVSTLRRYIKSGKVQSKLVGGKYFILDAEDAQVRHELIERNYYGSDVEKQEHGEATYSQSSFAHGAFFDESSLSAELRSQPLSPAVQRKHSVEHAFVEHESSEMRDAVAGLRLEVAGLREELAEMKMFVQLLEEQWMARAGVDNGLD